MPKYLLCYFMSCAMETHHTRHLEEEFTTNQVYTRHDFPLISQATMQLMFRPEALQNTSSSQPSSAEATKHSL